MNTEGHPVVLTQLQAKQRPGMGYLVHAGDSLVVIDGGYEEEADALRKEIAENGGRVDAWILTHPHPGHIGAAMRILQSPAGLTVGTVCCSLPESKWVGVYEPEYAGLVEDLQNLLKRYHARTDLQNGDQLSFGAAAFQVLNARNPGIVKSALNNSSLVLRLDCGGDAVLFLADAEEEAARLMMRRYTRELRCPVIQMSCHGRNGVGMFAYRHIHPTACFWPCPKWLWENDAGHGPGTGPWDTVRTRDWMERLGVRENFVAYEKAISVGLG